MIIIKKNKKYEIIMIILGPFNFFFVSIQLLSFFRSEALFWFIFILPLDKRVKSLGALLSKISN